MVSSAPQTPSDACSRSFSPSPFSSPKPSTQPLTSRPRGPTGPAGPGRPGSPFSPEGPMSPWGRVGRQSEHDTAWAMLMGREPQKCRGHPRSQVLTGGPVLPVRPMGPWRGWERQQDLVGDPKHRLTPSYHTPTPPVSHPVSRVSFGARVSRECQSRWALQGGRVRSQMGVTSTCPTCTVPHSPVPLLLQQLLWAQRAPHLPGGNKNHQCSFQAPIPFPQATQWPGGTLWS